MAECRLILQSACQVSIMINWQAMADGSDQLPSSAFMQAVDHEHYCINPDDYLKTKPFIVGLLVAVTRSSYD